MRYNPWAKGVYERICGKQKTRKKKAAVALARKLAVIAWAMLRDGKDWDTQQMIRVTESYGKMPTALKESLVNMKPKENSDQRKARHRREAREAKLAEQQQALKDKLKEHREADAKQKAKMTSEPIPESTSKPKSKPKAESKPKAQTKASKKLGRTRKPVSRG